MSEKPEIASPSGFLGALNRGDIVGFLVPGSLLLVAMSLIWPERKALFFLDDLTAPKLGYFVITAYAIGAVCEALGHLVDDRIWRKGFPTHWALVRDCDFITPKQQQAVLQYARDQGFGNLPRDKKAYVHGWTGAAVQMRAALTVNKVDARLEKHIENYGFFRGLFIVFLLILGSLAIRLLLTWLQHRDIGLVTAVVVGVAAFLGTIACFSAMRAFAVSYARELYAVYHQLSDNPLPAQVLHE